MLEKHLCTTLNKVLLSNYIDTKNCYEINNKHKYIHIIITCKYTNSKNSSIYKCEANKLTNQC